MSIGGNGGLTPILQLKNKARQRSGVDQILEQKPVTSNSYLLKASPAGQTIKASLPLRQCFNVSSHFFDTMNFLGLLIFLFYCSVAFGQSPLNKFSISFSTFNHAERIYNGSTTYLLTDTSIQVTKTYFGDTASKIIYSKKIKHNQTLISQLSKIQVDTLEDYYFNFCVMMTSGDEYYLDFIQNSTKKSISLHHYYLKQLDDIVQVINSTLPSKYQFRYLNKDEKQDCKL